jgi:excisionase family DNA binding protein
MPNSDTQSVQDWVPGALAQKALGVSESTLRRWADAGSIRTIRTLGNHRRYASDDIAAIQRGEINPSTQAAAAVPA